MQLNKILRSLARALGLALIGLVPDQAAAQNLTVNSFVVNPGPAFFNTITINAGGTLLANQFTVTAGGSQTALTANGTAGTAIGEFTNTLINLGNGNTGILANGSGATITIGAGSSVFSASGGAQFGVRVTNGATVNFVDGASIDIAGGSAAPVQTSSGGIFNMVGGSITKSGAGSNAILAGDGSTPGIVRLDGTTVIKQGTGGNTSGVWAIGAGSRAELTDTAIIVNQGGGQNYGVRATQGASVNLTGSSILMISNNSTGLQIATSGTAFVSGGSIVTEGAGGQGILVSDSGQNNGTFDGTVVRSNHGYGILAQGSMSSNLDFSNGASVTGGNGTLLFNQTSSASSVVNVTGTNDVVFIGDVDARNSLGATNIKLAEGTSLTGGVNVNNLTGAHRIEPAQPVTNLPRLNVNMDIDSSSVWNMRTSSTVDNLNVSPGARILFADLSRTLVLNRLTGTGGIFRMDVNLGEVRGDLIYILNSSHGDHSVDLTNVSPASDLPEHSALLVVRTPDGASTYHGEVDGGVFRYELVRGNGSSIIPNHDDWYLVPLGTPHSGELPPVDALTPPANDAIGTFSATSSMFHADLDSIEQQLADLRMSPVSPVSRQRGSTSPSEQRSDFNESKEIKEVKSTPTPSAGFWVRGFGGETEIDSGQSRKFKQFLGGGEIGFDRRFEAAGGDLYLGAYAGYLRATRDFYDPSDGTSNALNVGLYGEWVHPSGWFVEMVLKHMYVWNHISAPTSSSTVEANYRLPTFGGMLEIGKRWELSKVFIEPSASLAGDWGGSVDYEMSNGLKVRAGEQTSLRGRLGVRLGLHWELAKGQVLEPYAHVGVMNEFLGDDQITMNGFDFNPSLSGASVEASVGIAARLNQTFSVYAGYSYANGDKVRSPWAGNLGVRWEW